MNDKYQNQAHLDWWLTGNMMFRWRLHLHRLLAIRSSSLHHHYYYYRYLIKEHLSQVRKARQNKSIVYFIYKLIKLLLAHLLRQQSLSRIKHLAANFTLRTIIKQMVAHQKNHRCTDGIDTYLDLQALISIRSYGLSEICGANILTLSISTYHRPPITDFLQFTAVHQSLSISVKKNN